MLGVITLAAALLLSHQGPNEQLKELTLAVEMAPNNASLRLERAEVYRQLGQFNAALTDLSRAQTLGAPTAQTALERGLVLLAQKRPQDAEKALSNAIDHDASGKSSAVREAYLSRAKARTLLGQLDNAVRDYTRAIALRATPDLVMNRGKLQRQLGHLEETAAGYREGLKALGSVHVIMAALVEVEIERRRFKSALAVVESAPKTDFWQLQRADIYAAMGHTKAARTAYGQALTRINVHLKQRHNDLVLVRKAWALWGLGQKSQAKQLLTDVLSRRPTLPSARRLMARLKAQ